MKSISALLLPFFLAPGLFFAQTPDSLRAAAEVDSLHRRTDALLEQRKYDEALPVAEAAEARTSAVFGENSVLFADCQYRIGKILHQKRQYAAAEARYRRALEVREKSAGRENAPYGDCLNALGVLFLNAADYEKSEPVLLEARDLRRRVLGPAHPDFAASLNNLAIVARNTGHYEKAMAFLTESRAVREKAQGRENAAYAMVVNNIAAVCKDLGRFDESERLNLEAKAIRERTVGKEHGDYAMSLNNLAALYRAIGLLEKAESHALEAVALRGRLMGKTHALYANSLVNLAAVQRDMGRLDEAEKTLEEVLDIWEKTLGKEHANYALGLFSLASVCQERGQFGRAAALFGESAGIRERKLGREHPYVAQSLHAEAGALSALGQVEEAEPLFLEARDIRQKTLGAEHPDLVQSLLGLANFYRSLGRPDKAAAFLTESATLQKTIINRNRRFLAEDELLQNIGLTQRSNHQFFSFLRENPGAVPTGDAWDNLLFYKGLLLQNLRRTERLLATAPDSLRTLGADCKALRRRLAAEYAKPLAERREVPRLEARADSLEKALLRSLPTGPGDGPGGAAGWRQVQSGLKPGEAAVEFFHFRWYNHRGGTDSVFYAALLLLPDGQAPRPVPLFEEKQLDSLLRAGGEDASPAGKEAQINRLYAAQSRLYDLVWRPLEPHLTDAKTVWFSPSGALNRLNFSALKTPGDSGTLADRHLLMQISGSARLAEAPPVSPPKNNDAALFGGIRYDADSATVTQALGSLFQAGEPAGGDLAAAANATRGPSMYAAGRRTGAATGGGWAYLPFTEKEISEIERILVKNRLRPFVRKEAAASEEAFKRLGQSGTSPRILHVATHGFSFPEMKNGTAKSEAAEPVFKISDDPMMRAGLLFAGANRVWRGGAQIENLEDGVLTAYEISQMNLSGTELVVLSACETGIGDIRGHEGVYGLRRAFKIAGAEHLVLSLWQVPEKQTSQLMTAFYRNWLERKMPVPEAFRAAQLEMRDLGLEPFKWAGFVLVD